MAYDLRRLKFHGDDVIISEFAEIRRPHLVSIGNHAAQNEPEIEEAVIDTSANDVSLQNDVSLRIDGNFLLVPEIRGE
jgi:hypothetical protein